ncbi:MAG TPA: hypothetical protein VJQ54_17095 [Candidatus Sulfotelmatobacter sp.]|nr:hypothetical protein [Candidatus Sulfotelmatobacter sp.]
MGNLIFAVANDRLPMQYVIYVLIKLAFYTGWCWVGLRVWQPNSSRWRKASAFGVLRLAIGVVFGAAIFITVPAQQDDVLWKYITIYAPVRFVEWLILAWLLRRKSAATTLFTTLLWCLGGIIVSFVADFASPEGVAGHFCIGRCLC